MRVKFNVLSKLVFGILLIYEFFITAANGTGCG